MFYFLLLTAFTVSIDSFVCGFSLSFMKGKNHIVVLVIALTVYVMCLATNYLTIFFKNYLNETTASFGGLLLILVGVYNLLKNENSNKVKSSNVFKQSLLTGFAVGLDGAMANLSLALMGFNAFYVPMVIAIIHAVMVSLGILLANFKGLKKFKKINFLPPLILIFLGLYKLLGIFI
ncbi:MAG: manganese efflux pump [Clostridia bacterium]|nr:manganese efflux pump [Clostridia bacterium]